MMIIDDILDWARGRGYTAVYGSAEQVNEMFNNTPFADSKDGTVVVMHLVTDSATVDGRDRAVVAVYFASLCPFDFDGEALLPEQERLKGIGKELLNDIRTGNVLTYDTPRWQYGYDDYAENVCWVCLRVTLTVSAADCVPVLPPTPPPEPEYEYICPQSIGYGNTSGYPNPVLLQSKNRAVATMCYPQSLIDKEGDGTILIIDKYHAQTQSIITLGYITEELIQQQKMALAHESSDRHMTQETEDWLRERIGWLMTTVHEAHYGIASMKDYQKYMIIGTSGKTFESKMGYVVQ